MWITWMMRECEREKRKQQMWCAASAAYDDDECPFIGI
jgi:hypothetical protein